MKLNELRRSSATIPKQSGLQQLMSYVNTLSTDQINKTFVSFTKLEKLGINPGSTYDTPNGIYAYRLEYVLSQLEKKNKDSFEEIVPFAGDAPYFNVFEVGGNILDLGDMDSLKDAFLKLAKVDRTLLPSGYFADTFAKQVWSRSLFIANGKQQTPTSSREIARKWNTVFRKVGIDGVVDPGFGIIHSNEQDQAVFFTSSVIKNVKRFVNTKSSGSVSKQAPFTNEVAIFFRQRVFRHPSISRTLKPAFKTLVNHYLKRVFLKDSGARESARVEYERLLNSLTKQILTACISTGVVENGSNFAKTLVWTIKDALSGGVINTRFPDNTRVDDEDKIKQIDQWSSKSEEEWKQFIRNFTNSVNAKMPEAETLHIRSMMRTSDSVDDNLLEAGLKESEQNLTELRRSSATMPKQSGVKQFLAYADTLSEEEKKNTFVSFTSIDKLGINPKSEFDTPNGIYAYRLEYVLQHAKKLTNVDQPFSKIVPFAGSAPYFNVFQVEGNILHIGDSKSEVEALKKVNAYAVADAQARGVPRKKLPDGYHSDTFAQQVWSNTLFIANGNRATPISSPVVARKWATVFRKIGIDGVVDPGTRTIHSNEPDQAVFFTSEVIKNVKRFVNTKHDGSISKHAPHTLEVGLFFKQKVFRHPSISRTFKPEFKTLLKLSFLKRYSPDSEEKKSAVIEFEVLINKLGEAVQKASVLSGLVEPGSNIETEIKTVTVDSLHSACFIGISHAADIINAEDDKVNKLIDAFVSSSANLVPRWNKFTRTFAALTERALRSSETYHIRSMMRPADPVDFDDLESWLKESKLTELRRSSAIMPKQSAARSILEYAKTLSAEEVKQTFISFTSIEKLGINPGSTFNTPNGIYAYPLEYVIKRIGKSLNKAMYDVVPFAGEMPYLNIFKTNGNVFDLADTNQAHDVLDKLNSTFSIDKNFVLPKDYKQSSAAQMAWSLALYIANGGKQTAKSSPIVARKWATVFRKIGINGVVDSTGQGIIHPAEKTQAVFFSSEAIVPVKRIVNTFKSGSTKKEPVKLNRLGHYFAKRLLQANNAVEQVKAAVTASAKSYVNHQYSLVDTNSQDVVATILHDGIVSKLSNPSKFKEVFGPTAELTEFIDFQRKVLVNTINEFKVSLQSLTNSFSKIAKDDQVKSVDSYLSGDKQRQIWKTFYGILVKQCSDWAKSESRPVTFGEWVKKNVPKEMR